MLTDFHEKQAVVQLTSSRGRRYEIGNTLGMPMTTADEASLINGVTFLEELKRFEHAAEHAPDPGLRSRRYADAFDAIESRLPRNPAAHQTVAPHHERAPIGEPNHPDVEQPAPAKKQVPFMAAALVLAACLTAGATTAAFVLHDRVTQITARRLATR